MWLSISGDARQTVTTLLSFVSFAMSLGMTWVLASLLTTKTGADPVAVADAQTSPCAGAVMAGSQARGYEALTNQSVIVNVAHCK